MSKDEDRARDLFAGVRANLPVDVGAAMASGRRIKRIRRTVAGGAAAVVVAIAATGLALAPGAPGTVPAVPAASPSIDAGENEATPTLPVDPAGNGTTGPASPAESMKRWALNFTPIPSGMPLSPYLDAVQRSIAFADSKVSTKELNSWRNGREKALAECMKSHGFDFFLTSDSEAAGSDKPSPDDYAGVDKLPIPLLDNTRDLVVVEGYGIADPPQDDPNEVYVDSLSTRASSQYAAYFRDCNAEVGAAYPDPTDKWSSLDVRNVFGDQTMDMALFYSTRSVDADPHTISLNREWRSCMAKSGHSMEPIRDGAKDGGVLDGPEGAYRLAVRTAPDGAVAELTADQAKLPQDQKSLVGSQVEIEIALADFDCRAQTDYVSRITDIQRSMEQDYVDANKKELDRMVAFVDQEVG